jgi:preprotein translocase subunit YajC
MFASPAYAQAGGAASNGTTLGLLSILPYLAIFVIFYFLLIRPQQRRAKAHQAMIGAVKKNDVVVTGGGLVGKVTRVDEAEVEVELAPNVRVKALKGTLSEVRPHGQKPAND